MAYLLFIHVYKYKHRPIISDSEMQNMFFSSIRYWVQPNTMKKQMKKKQVGLLRIRSAFYANWNNTSSSAS
jgi:hypothetical protein